MLGSFEGGLGRARRPATMRMTWSVSNTAGGEVVHLISPRIVN